MKAKKVTLAWTIKYASGRLDPMTYMTKRETIASMRDNRYDEQFPGSRAVRVEIREVKRRKGAKR